MKPMLRALFGAVLGLGLLGLALAMPGTAQAQSKGKIYYLVPTLLDEFQKGLQDDACRIVQRVALFDEFRAKSNTSGLGADEKSLAFRVTLQDTGGTLQDETVDLAIKSLVDRLARVYGARLRG